MTNLKPLSLAGSPSLITDVFPVQKLSFEAQTERKAVAGQTLTGLGSYWKGRKPLILVRAIVLATLLPKTKDKKRDLQIFEKLMAFDDHGLARRAFAKNQIKPSEIATRLEISNPLVYFTNPDNRAQSMDDGNSSDLAYPTSPKKRTASLRWRRDIGDDQKIHLIERTLSTYSTYEEKAKLCKRPEEVDQTWLYAPIWASVNAHYAKWGIFANSFPELLQQIGILRFGRHPRVGDIVSGGGSIPFEAARLGCDVYASDLNPIACMLTWGAINVVGASHLRRIEFDKAQKKVFQRINNELIDLGVEHDEQGNRAKTYLYCLETKCPETGWSVPMLPSFMISPKQKTIAKLKPIYEDQRFDIEVIRDVADKELIRAENGTIQDGNLVYDLDGKTFRTSIKALRGDRRQNSQDKGNQLRRWENHDVYPRTDDIFQERLYAIQWITKQSASAARHITYFEGVNEKDLERERMVEKIVADNFVSWQAEGFIPNMEIDDGYTTNTLIRTRGWSYWHHLFNPRQLLLHALSLKNWRRSKFAELGWLNVAKMIDFNSRLCRWATSNGGGLGGAKGVFSNQVLNPLYNYATRSWAGYGAASFRISAQELPESERIIVSNAAHEVRQICDLWVTDPPYADAVIYHEITELFISWLRTNPPQEFQKWHWDSRRALAIKGSGTEFRRSMVDAYKALTDSMPENGLQCIMFTHQDTTIWSDMVNVFWASGLQVLAAWYIATETTSELKKGAYVQGTIIMILRKRMLEERNGFKQHILPIVRNEVRTQIDSMLNLNSDVNEMADEPVFSDSDLQMAGYAAALKVLTSYTHIGGEDVTNIARQPRQHGVVTVVDDIVKEAVEIANSLLVPEGLSSETWFRLTGIERFFFRMMDMEFTGFRKLDNYQTFSKALRVENYTEIMKKMDANDARLKEIDEFSSRDLLMTTEIGPTTLGHLIVSIQQLLCDTDPSQVVRELRTDLTEFFEARPVVINLLHFIQRKARKQKVREVAEILRSRIKNMYALDQ